jgi:hypothetical protein
MKHPSKDVLQRFSLVLFYNFCVQNLPALGRKTEKMKENAADRDN